MNLNHQYFCLCLKGDGWRLLSIIRIHTGKRKGKGTFLSDFKTSQTYQHGTWDFKATANQ